MRSMRDRGHPTSETPELVSRISIDSGSGFSGAETMSPEQVRVIYEHCRQVAKVLTSEMRRLLTEIVKYRADKRHRNNLRSALVELLRCMPMNVETIEKLKKDVDWTLVESVAERTSMNQKSSALYAKQDLLVWVEQRSRLMLSFLYLRARVSNTIFSMARNASRI